MKSQLFCIPQRYDFSSKSQQAKRVVGPASCCFVYRKGTIFQANHNKQRVAKLLFLVVLYTAKVRFFKQITTAFDALISGTQLFCIPQRYDFSSKSQQAESCKTPVSVVLYTAKVRFFKQITTLHSVSIFLYLLFCIPQRYDFSSKSQRLLVTP